MLPKFKVFVSSPGDVAEERVVAERLLERLRGEWASRLDLEGVFWEHEPLRATESFQPQLPSSAEMDAVVCILWSRLGTRLPPEVSRPDGRRYESGTEYEFEIAAEGWRTKGRPELLVYRKTAEPLMALSDPRADERLAQKRALDSFLKTWFENEDGSLRSAFHPFRSPEELEELLEEHLRRLLERRAPALAAGAAPRPTWTSGSPFRGLAAFEREHAPVFFGRTRAIGQVLTALRAQAADRRPFLLLLGMSGNGKSSLVRAGVLPLLSRPGVIEGVGLWRSALFIPGRSGGDLADGLAAALLQPEALPELAADGTTAAQIAETLRGSPVAAEALVKGALSQAAAENRRTRGLERQPDVRLALVVDQMEDIFTLPHLSPDDRGKFIAVLASLARGGRVWVIGTLRSDFYARCAEIPELIELKSGRGQLDLLPPTPAEIGQIIRRPALAAGLRFEEDPETGQGLDEILRDAAARHPEGLPLLEFTLDQLYESRLPDGTLTKAAYDGLGGVEGAVSRRAEEVFTAQSARVQEALPSLLRLLITVRPEGEPLPTARRALLAAFSSPEARTLAGAFVDARILIADQSDDGQPILGLTHEALLTHWPRLRDWLARDRQFLQIRAWLEPDCARWQQEDETEDLLVPEGKALNEAASLLDHGRGELHKKLIDYIEASLAVARRRRRRKHQTAAAWVILLFLAAGLLWIGKERLLRPARADAEVKEATVLEQNGHTAQALAHLARAVRTNPENLEARSLIFDSLLRNGWAFPLAVIKYKEGVQFSSDSLRFLTASPDGTARIWNSQTGKLLGAMEMGDAVRSARFSPDGRRIATTSGTTAQLWDAETFQAIGAPIQHKGLIWSRFSTDGKLLATWSNDDTIRIWDGLIGQPMGAPLTLQGIVFSLEFSPDGRFVVTSSSDNHVEDMIFESGIKVAVWDLKQRQQPLWSFSPETTGEGYSEFNPRDSSRILATFGQVAQIYDSQSGRKIGDSLKHNGNITSAHFSPDGLRIVTTSEDHTAQLWDARSGAPLEGAQGMNHEGKVNSAAWSRDGLLLVTTSEDKTARLWNGKTGEPISEPMVHDERVTAAAIDPSNRWVVTASDDKTVRVWSAQKGAAVAEIVASGDPYYKSAINMSGDQVAADWRLMAQLWDLRTGSRTGRSITVTNRIDHLEFSPGGDRLEVYQYNRPFGLTQLWDLRTFESTPGFSLDIQRRTSFAFSRDGKSFAAGNEGGVARVWSSATGKEITPPLLHPPESGANAVIIKTVAFSPDGETLATGTSTGKVYLWDIRTGGRSLLTPEVRTRENPTGISTVEFSLDGRRVLSASGDHTARLWTWPIGLEVCTFSHHAPVNTARFSPDGRRVVTASRDKTAVVWDEYCQPIGQPMAHKDEVESADFSKDGTRVLTVSKDGQVRIWDARSGRPLINPLSHDSSILSSRLSPDGGQAITVSSDGIFVWDIPAGTPKDAEILARIAEAAGGYTVDERGLLAPLADQIGSLSALRRETADAPLGQPTAASIIRWFLADRWTRTISPLSRITVPELIRRRLAEKAGDHAERAFPGHPLLSSSPRPLTATTSPSPTPRPGSPAATRISRAIRQLRRHGSFLRLNSRRKLPDCAVV